jgi:hypothetical protein
MVPPRRGFSCFALSHCIVCSTSVAVSSVLEQFHKCLASETGQFVISCAFMQKAHLVKTRITTYLRQCVHDVHDRESALFNDLSLCHMLARYARGLVHGGPLGSLELSDAGLIVGKAHQCSKAPAEAAIVPSAISFITCNTNTRDTLPCQQTTSATAIVSLSSHHNTSRHHEY